MVNEDSNGATYYLMLNEGKSKVVQGIVFDAIDSERTTRGLHMTKFSRN